jgi:hypothetical protein
LRKLGPTNIAAEFFICQELLDVPTAVGIQALLKYKDADKLLEYWKQYRREKRRKAEELINSQGAA